MEADNMDVFWGQVRVLLGAASGFMVGKGWVTADVASAVVGIVMFALPAWLSQKAMKKSAAKLEEAKQGPRDEWTPKERAVRIGESK